MRPLLIRAHRYIAAAGVLALTALALTVWVLIRTEQEFDGLRLLALMAGLSTFWCALQAAEALARIEELQSRPLIPTGRK
jgi:hypothetical protein